ncbi:energy transducer TonB [Aliikangiella sp. IMCC44653]
MQNHQGVIDEANQPQISQLDKVMFCGFLAIVFHAMLFFGLGFKLPDLSKSTAGKTFNVVLAQFEADKKPEKADYISQANQEAGGSSEQKLAPSTTQKALFNNPDQISSEPQVASRQMTQQPPTPDVINSQGRAFKMSNPQQKVEVSKPIPDAAALIDKSYRLSGLIANLDNSNVNQALKGRKRQVSAATHRASDALYLDSWRRKIEMIGNQNYPQKAKVDKIFGNLTMKVAINKDGTINQVQIMQSSGNKVLDNAALKIVRLAAPFKPLTEEMTKDTDILEIIRVWQFQPDYILNTN